MSLFVQNSKKTEMEIFAFCVITFEPIITKTSDHNDLSFVKDKHTYGEKMARKGHSRVIYKFSFVSDWSICRQIICLPNKSHVIQIILYPKNCHLKYRLSQYEDTHFVTF